MTFTVYFLKRQYGSLQGLRISFILNFKLTQLLLPTRHAYGTAASQVPQICHDMVKRAIN